MEEPERKYNLPSCFIMGLIGAAAVGLAWFILRYTRDFFSALSSGSAAASPVVAVFCCSLLAMPIMLFVARRSRPQPRSDAFEQNRRRERLDTFVAKGEVKAAAPADAWECEQCGAIVDANASVCPSCGVEFED